MRSSGRPREVFEWSVTPRALQKSLGVQSLDCYAAVRSVSLFGVYVCKTELPLFKNTVVTNDFWNKAFSCVNTAVQLDQL